MSAQRAVDAGADDARRKDLAAERRALEALARAPHPYRRGMDQGHGDIIETRVGDIVTAATFPDFVFRAKDVPKGAATREIGDLLMLVGRRLLVISIRARDPDKQESDTPERAVAWRKKAIDGAANQIKGTVRALTQETGLVLRSDRGIELPWTETAVDDIIGVIVVDYARNDDYYPDQRDFPIPVTVMETKDWEMICTRLLRATAIMNYVEIRAKVGLTIPLRNEDLLLEQIIQAESAHELDQVTPDDLTSLRWYEAPSIPSDDVFGSMPDHKYAAIVWEMIESAADPNPVFSSFVAAHDYLEIVSFLDAIPLMHQVELGKHCLAKVQEAGRTNSLQSLVARTPRGPFLFCAAPGSSEHRLKLINALTQLRHAQIRNAVYPDLTTLGVVTDAGVGQGRSYGFCLVAGDSDLSAAQLAKGEELFGEASPYAHY